MPHDADPYLYPGTSTLKNKLGLRDPQALERAQDERAAARYAILERNLPQPPFTFETLKDIHRQLFDPVYDWAGQPRTIGIRKADWTGPGAQFTAFTNPAMIEAMASVAFKAIDNGRALMDLDRQAFAARAAQFLNDVNLIHPFREGNGRSQRGLLSAIAAAAGHPIAFDVATSERMVATSIAAGNGDLGGFTRLIAEATDPRRVEAMRGALGFLQKAFPAWNDTYIATTTAGQRYEGILVDRTKTDYMMRVTARLGGWIAIGDAADLPRDAPGRKAPVADGRALRARHLARLQPPVRSRAKAIRTVTWGVTPSSRRSGRPLHPTRDGAAPGQFKRIAASERIMVSLNANADADGICLALSVADQPPTTAIPRRGLPNRGRLKSAALQSANAPPARTPGLDPSAIARRVRRNYA